MTTPQVPVSADWLDNLDDKLPLVLRHLERAQALTVLKGKFIEAKGRGQMALAHDQITSAIELLKQALLPF